jgi:zinc transporter 2
MKILHQGEGGYHMGGGGCSHDHGDGEHKHEGGEKHEHKHGAGCSHGHGDEEKGGHGHSHSHDDKGKVGATRRNINVDAAFLHALGDMIMSIGVCVAGSFIYFGGEDFTVADPICTFIFSCIVCFTVTPIVKNCINVLMEGAPAEIDSNDLIAKIQGLGEDVGLHDFHIWSISVGKFALSTHVTTKQNS